jgi:hypothetical protein
MMLVELSHKGLLAYSNAPDFSEALGEIAIA